MCGIAGILSLEPPEPALLRRMTDAIAHRGPDDEGVWVDREAGVGLAHRRLSIVDLSPRATSRCSRRTAASSSTTMAKSTIIVR